MTQDNHDIDPKTRLNHVIYRLNRTQIKPLIRFHTNGTGTGVHWSLCDPKPMRLRPRVAKKLIIAL